jgi:O-antigen/teichoic acid export membrane protein
VAVSMFPDAVRLSTGFVTSILLARGLGPAGLGEYALVISVSDVAMTLSDLGIGQTAIRYASRAASQGDSEGQFATLRWAFRRRMSLVILISLLAFALAPAVAQHIWHMGSLAPKIRLGLLIGVFGALAHIPSVYFQSLKRFEVNATVLSGQALISFIGILLLAVLNHWSVQAVVLVSVITAGLGAVVFLSLVPKPALIPLGPCRAPLGGQVRRFWQAPGPPEVRSGDLPDSDTARAFAGYMLLAVFLVMLTQKADLWLMGFFVDKGRIGIYNAATRFTLPLVILLNALNTALWPRASALVDVKDTVSLMRKTLRMCSLVTAGAFVYAILGPLFAPLLFGGRYASSVLLGQLLCFRYVIAMLIIPASQVGYNFGLVRVFWIINAVQLVAVVGINVLLLPRIGPMASTLALIANEVIGGSSTGMILWRKMRLKSAA